MHCDETMDLVPKEWSLQVVPIGARFARKYGPGNVPSSIRVTFAAVAGDDDAAEALVDSLQLMTDQSGSGPCLDVSLTSAVSLGSPHPPPRTLRPAI